VVGEPIDYRSERDEHLRFNHRRGRPRSELAANLTNPYVFSQLYAGPVTSSLRIVFASGFVMSLVAALASALRRNAESRVLPAVRW
jgi:hypothetical protein